MLTVVSDPLVSNGLVVLLECGAGRAAEETDAIADERVPMVSHKRSKWFGKMRT